MTSDEIKCGTFLDLSFGGILRSMRLRRGITLRDMARRLEMDSGNYSKIEQSALPPPNSKKKIRELTKPLKLNSDEFNLLFATAYNFHLGRFQVKFNQDNPNEAPNDQQ